MTHLLLGALSGLFISSLGTFCAGWVLRGISERTRVRRGGYVRRVPMASVHPREPKP